MTWSDDDQSMSARSDEELLRGMAADADPALTALVAMLRASADDPAPRPTDALATLLRTGVAPVPVAARASRTSTSVTIPFGTRLRRLSGRAAALGLAAKIALTAGVAVASVGAAATIHAGPEVVQERAAATWGSIVHVLAPASHAAPPHGAPAAPEGAAGDDEAVPGAPSHRPGSTASPTTLPAPADDRRVLLDPAGSDHTAPSSQAGQADQGSHRLPLAPDQAVRPTDPATEPTRSAFGGMSQLSGAVPTPAPPWAPTPSAEPTHATHGG